METLHIDALTAEACLEALAPRGNDLATMAQAVDEDWKRFGPKGGARHTISTMGNRQDCPPTGLAYYNTQLIQPGDVPAERRADIADRFLRGKPRLCAEVVREDGGYRLLTAVLPLSDRVVATLDHERQVAAFHLLGLDLPESAQRAAEGMPLAMVADVPHAMARPLAVTGFRRVDRREMWKLTGREGADSIVVETMMPDWTSVPFQPRYDVFF